MGISRMKHRGRQRTNVAALRRREKGGQKVGSHCGLTLQDVPRSWTLTTSSVYWVVSTQRPSGRYSSWSELPKRTSYQLHVFVI